MKRIAAIVGLAIALLVAAVPVNAQHRLGDTLIGAGAGAVVGGPVGAVVGGAVGYTQGPRIERAAYYRRYHGRGRVYRYHRRRFR